MISSNTEGKFQRRFEAFESSLEALLEARTRDENDSFVLSGTSSKFSITFELAWKVIKDILIEHYGIVDFISGSPKEVLKRAFKTELISDDIWLEMLDCRNNLIHDYNMDLIKASFKRITGEYSDKFIELKEQVEGMEKSGVMRDE